MGLAERSSSCTRWRYCLVNHVDTNWGQAGSTNTSLLGAIQRDANGRIGVHVTTLVNADNQQSALDGDAFAQFARNGDAGMYGSKGSVTYSRDARAACYTTMQCTTQLLDAASTASSAVAAICLGSVVDTPCAGPASFIRTGTGAFGTVLTGISAYQGKASW